MVYRGREKDFIMFRFILELCKSSYYFLFRFCFHMHFLSEIFASQKTLKAPQNILVKRKLWKRAPVCWWVCAYVNAVTCVLTSLLRPHSSVPAVHPLRRAAGGAHVSLCGDTWRDHRQAQHGGEGHRSAGRHGKGSVWPSLQLDCQPHQLPAKA